MADHNDLAKNLSKILGMDAVAKKETKDPLENLGPHQLEVMRIVLKAQEVMSYFANVTSPMPVGMGQMPHAPRSLTKEERCLYNLALEVVGLYLKGEIGNMERGDKAFEDFYVFPPEKKDED